jgi:multisubunit Na+/H+ antiporter MnhE subunit
MLNFFRYLGWWFILIILYLLLAGTLDLSETVAGVIIATLTMGLLTVVRGQRERHYRARLRWLSHFKRLPGQVITDTALLITALWRRLTLGEKRFGVFQTLPFNPGAEKDPEDATRRALVTSAISLPPNSYVVAIDREEETLIVHQLVPSEPPGQGDQEWPV